MKTAIRKDRWGRFILGIILPTLLAMAVSISSIYFVILPAFAKSFMEDKKEMIRELTTVAWNILVFYEKQERQNVLSREQAQKLSIEEIRHLRYGQLNKDYFFITDTEPRMIMHPYSPELEGQDLSSYKDIGGQFLFVEMKNIATTMNSGYLNYTWHTKYDDELNVPKLSFVKLFSPWGWVVGTGVFLDDVERKTKAITSRLTSLVLAGALLFCLLLIVVSLQSFSIERRRRLAEQRLSLSREKYKALAESTTAPMVMIHGNEIIYANKSLYSLLEYSRQDFEQLSPDDLFPEGCEETESGKLYLHQAQVGQIPPEKHEGLLLSRNGSFINVELSFSSIQLADQKAIVMTARDTRSAELQLRSEKTEHNHLTRLLSQLNIGLFQVKDEPGLPFITCDDTTSQLFGISSYNESDELSFLDLVTDVRLRVQIEKSLELDQTVLVQSIEILALNATRSRTYALSLIGRKSALSGSLFYDGIILDITKQKNSELQRENLIVELQTSLLFLNQPIKYALKNFVSCTLDTPINSATQIMAKGKQSSLLVTSESGEMIGIITDMVLRERVLAENLSYDTPVYKVMSSPLICIEDSAMIFEAILLMQKKNIKHLVVTNSSGDAVSIISNEDLLEVHRYSTSFILNQIKEATSFEHILEVQPRIPRIVKSLTDSGAHAKNITRIITTVSDAILEKIIEFTIDDLGEPPVSFAFISVGSEGRGEQTLVTDQDNALVYEDSEEENRPKITEYFEEFGRRVCTCLDKAGYELCKGDIMAMNPKWCQPLSVWQGYFTQWIKKGSPQDLLEVNIFFDLRSVYGDQSFITQLRQTINALATSRAPFLQHLAQNSLSFSPPLDFFGNIHAKSDDNSNTFDIKKVIACIVGFARVFSIKNGLVETNTILRIEQLHKKGAINTSTYEEISEAYDYLMKLRFRHQVGMIDAGEKPDNFIRIDDLSHLDKTMLKKTFAQVSSMQKSLSYTFSGIA